MTACTDLDEKVNDRIDANVYYQNEASVVGAVAAIYGQTSTTLGGQYFFHLSEYPADQLTWRVWNGGLWGWDEAEKTVLSWQNWTSESKIIKDAWSNIGKPLAERPGYLGCSFRGHDPGEDGAVCS